MRVLLIKALPSTYPDNTQFNDRYGIGQIFDASLENKKYSYESRGDPDQSIIELELGDASSMSRIDILRCELDCFKRLE